MHVLGPPVGGGTVESPRLVRAVRGDFAGPSLFAANDQHRSDLREYVTDLVAPRGLPVRDEVIDDGAGMSYGEMGGALIDELVPADEPVDILILAFAAPDIRPGRATATYLSHRCPGEPFAFAVCDQGAIAPFTALRLLAGYAAAGFHRALLLVAEQVALPHEPAGPARLPTVNTAVAFLFEGTVPGAATAPGTAAAPGEVGPDRSAPPGLEIATGVAPGQVADRLTSTVTGLSAAAGTLLVGACLGEHLAGRRGEPPAGGHESPAAGPPGWTVGPAAAGRPFTGPWWQLAGRLGTPAGTEPLMLAEYEPALGCLAVAAW